MKDGTGLDVSAELTSSKSMASAEPVLKTVSSTTEIVSVTQDFLEIETDVENVTIPALNALGRMPISAPHVLMSHSL